MSVAKTAKSLGTTEDAVKVHSTEARKKIESQFLEPKGIKKISQLAASYGISKSVYETQIVNGRLSAFKLFSLYYTFEETFQRFARNISKREVDPEFLDRGFILISTLPVYEYNKLSYKKNKWGVVEHDGRLYIHQDNYQKFKEQSQNRPILRFRPEDSSYQPLAFFANTQAEYNRLLNAAKFSTLHFQRIRRRWFTTQTAVDEFLNSKKQL